MILSFPHACQDGYATLARLAARMKLRLWKIRPKLHMFCHLQLLSGNIILGKQNMFVWGPLKPCLIYVNLMCQLRLDLQHMLSLDQCNHCLNPSILMTWSDEDYIGRVSRICRRTHALTAPSRCIDRALGFYRRQWASVFGEHYLRLADF